MKKPGEYYYLTMSGEPLEDGEYALHHRWPPYGELGREIEFHELPIGGQGMVTEIYRDLWDLTD